jgi:hypothetical protein
MEMDISEEPFMQEKPPETAQLPATEPPSPSGGGTPGFDDKEQQDLTRMKIIAGVGAAIVLIAIGFSIYWLGWVAVPAEVTRLRDIFIIFMALVSLLTGVALVLLLFQVTRLINLLNNEIRPILDSTNETVSTLRGTTAFLSNNLVEPVIKLNEYLAGFGQLLQVIGIMRKSTKK